MTAIQRPPKNWRGLPELTLTEAAACLSISRSRAYEMAQAGDLPTHLDHLGRQKVLPVDLEALLAAQADDQPDLFAQDDQPKPVSRHVPSAPPEPRQAATQVPVTTPERTPPTAVFLAAKAALKRSRRGAL